MDGKVIAVLGFGIIAALVLLLPGILDSSNESVSVEGTAGDALVPSPASDRGAAVGGLTPTGAPVAPLAPEIEPLAADMEGRQGQKRGPLASEEAGLFQRLRDLEDALGGSDPEIRSTAIQELANWGQADPAVTRALLRAATQDPSDALRLQAVSSLMTIRDPEVIPDLAVIAAEDASEQVREAAAEAVEYLAAQLEAEQGD